MKKMKICAWLCDFCNVLTNVGAPKCKGCGAVRVIYRKDDKHRFDFSYEAIARGIR